MAYWMQSVNGYDQAALGNIFRSNMVAEPVVTQSLGDIMPVDFDPAEADRQVRLEIANAVGNVRQELFDAVSALNTKLDVLTVMITANDGLVKQTADNYSTFVGKEFAGVASDLISLSTKVDEHTNMLVQLYQPTGTAPTQPPGIQVTPNPFGIPVTPNPTAQSTRNVMDHKCVQNLEKLTNVATDFHIWQLRFKNCMVQVNPLYKQIIDSCESLNQTVTTYEAWWWNVYKNIAVTLQVTEEEVVKLKNDLYCVLVEKCTSNQVLSFANDDSDGIYAYVNLYRGFRLTAGLGQIEKRDFLTHPPSAKKDGDIYDCVLNWERELKEQEKLAPSHSRPLLSPVIKGAVLKSIACGNIKEYIKTHETLKDYDSLREDVLRMAMFCRAEANVTSVKPQTVPMDINAVIEKLKEQMSPVTKKESFSFGSNDQTVKSEETTPDDMTKLITEINAMVKGKGKGIECYNCGKTGHMAKDCWSTKGKGAVKGGGKSNGFNGKGYPSYDGGYQGKGYPPQNFGKGNPKGGCFICGGPHWQKDCPKGGGKGGGKKGVNGVDEEGGFNVSTSGESVTGLSLGGGKGGDQAQVEWDYQQELFGGNWDVTYSIDYDHHEWAKVVTGNPVTAKPPTMIDHDDEDGHEWSRVRSRKKKLVTQYAKTCACTPGGEHQCRMKPQVNQLTIEEMQKRFVNEKMRLDEKRKQLQEDIMTVKGEWEKIRFTGDSGAVDHVITKETGKAFKVNSTAASRAGIGFRAANGTSIEVFGERRLNGVTQDNDGFKMNCQVTNVKKNLASFVKMVKEGNDIVLSMKGSFIKNVNNGKIIKLDLEAGTPQFDVWVKKPTDEQPIAGVSDEEENSSKQLASGFQRLDMHI